MGREVGEDACNDCVVSAQKAAPTVTIAAHAALSKRHVQPRQRPSKISSHQRMATSTLQPRVHWPPDSDAASASLEAEAAAREAETAAPVSGTPPSITSTPGTTAGAWEMVVVEVEAASPEVEAAAVEAEAAAVEAEAAAAEAEAAAVEMETATVASRREAAGGRSRDGDTSARPGLSGMSMLSIPEVTGMVLRCWPFRSH